MKLTKGDLVKFEGQLSIVEEYTKGKSTLLIFILDAKTSLVVRLDEVTKATRSDVEQYLKEKGWVHKPLFQYDNEDNHYQLRRIGEYWAIWLPNELMPTNFDTAPAQLAEAILMARLLNATKD